MCGGVINVDVSSGAASSAPPASLASVMTPGDGRMGLPAAQPPAAGYDSSP